VLTTPNIAHDGEWIECRLLASRERMNCWFRECGNRVIRASDIVVFDTDMDRPNGYPADISRSYDCPGRKPSLAQRKLHALAAEQAQFNMALLRPDHRQPYSRDRNGLRGAARGSHLSAAWAQGRVKTLGASRPTTVNSSPHLRQTHKATSGGSDTCSMNHPKVLSAGQAIDNAADCRR
jgi:hypothetical protein